MDPTYPTTKAIQAVNWNRPARIIDGKDALTAKVAVPFVERPLVSIGEAPSKSTLRAPCRRRNFHLFIEREILRFNPEFLLTILTSFSFRVHELNLIFFVAVL